MLFKTNLPSAGLRPFIKCFWTLESAPGELEGTTYHIIPINRIIDAAGALRISLELTLTEVAYPHGYYDPVHFSRKFRPFTKFTPSGFLSRIDPDSKLFNFKGSR